jgi:hypothetical protein
MTNLTITTKLTRESAEKQTILHIDWTGCTEETLKAFAVQALVVKLQGRYRKNGIPSEDTVRALELAPGTRAPKVALTPVEAARKAFAEMSADEKRAFIEANFDAS